MIRYFPPQSGYFVSLCSLCFSVFLSAKIPVFIPQARKARRISRREWKRLGYASQMDEEQLSSWPWIISIFASVKGD